MNILEQIVAERRSDVKAAAADVPLVELQRQAAGLSRRSLKAQFGRRHPLVIAEMKKASPSAGLLAEHYDPAGRAQAYEAAGAAGLSVLTEPRHFLGDRAHLDAARVACSLPVLRKDFICDPYQVYETAAWGADVLLLIVAALPDVLLQELYGIAVECGLEVLAESHTAEELERALVLEEAVIGVNSRDLKTLRTDLQTARDLSIRIPDDRLAVAESGIRDRNDIDDLLSCGYSGFLVGESLMRGRDPMVVLRTLTAPAEERRGVCGDGEEATESL